MKRISLVCLVFATLVVICISGCGKKEPVAREEEKAPSGKTTTPKTSFEAVTSQLDTGGDLYVYVGTEQLLKDLSGKVAGWRQLGEAIPNLNAENRQNISKAIDIITNLIRGSGIEEIAGLGMSSVPREAGLRHSKMLLYHAPGSSSGFLWNLCGREPHALVGLNLLPANTAMATFSDLDVPLMWSVVQKQVTQAGFPQAEELLKKLPEEFEKATGLNWEKVLGSLGGDFGFALTLDDSKTVTIPLPRDQQLEIPQPALMLVAKVKDDAIFKRIDDALKDSGQQTIASNKPGLQMRTLPLPLPLPIQVGLTVAQSEGYLFIASSDLIVQQALAVKSGEKPGLKSTEEFKRLAKDVPEQGNHFTFVSERFGKTIHRLQRQALELAGSEGGKKQEWLQSLLSGSQPVVSYSVGAHTTEGWLVVANGNQHPGRFLVVSAAVPVGVATAIAVSHAKAGQAAKKNE